MKTMWLDRLSCWASMAVALLPGLNPSSAVAAPAVQAAAPPPIEAPTKGSPRRPFALSIPLPPIVSAVVRVSSAAATARRAFDASAETRWCPSAKDADGELTVVFDRSVRIKRLTLMVGRMNPQTSGYRPPPVEVRLDDQTARLDPRENGRNPLDADEINGKQGRTLSIRLASTNRSDPDRCLSEVIVDLDGVTWALGLNEQATQKLPTFVDDLTVALRSCDRTALTPLVRLPVVRQELQVGYAGADYFHARTKSKPYRSIPALARYCNELVYPGDTDRHETRVEPTAEGPIGPGEFRVRGDFSGGVKYWDLVWLKDRWMLSRISFTDFE